MVTRGSSRLQYTRHAPQDPSLHTTTLRGRDAPVPARQPSGLRHTLHQRPSAAHRGGSYADAAKVVTGRVLAGMTGTTHGNSGAAGRLVEDQGSGGHQDAASERSSSTNAEVRELMEKVHQLTGAVGGFRLSAQGGGAGVQGAAATPVALASSAVPRFVPSPAVFLATHTTAAVFLASPAATAAAVSVAPPAPLAAPVVSAPSLSVHSGAPATAVLAVVGYVSPFRSAADDSVATRLRGANPKPLSETFSGRLPFDDETSFEEVVNYISGVRHAVVQLRDAAGNCDPLHWRKE